MVGTIAVQQAMYQHLVESHGTAISSSLVAWPNIDFTPPSTGLWYEVAFLPGEPRSAGLGMDAPNRYVGIFQVTVCATHGIGEGTVVSEAERIVTAYKRGTVIMRYNNEYGTKPSLLLYPGIDVFPINYEVAGKITKAWRGPGYVSSEPAYYQVPVSIQFWADVEN